MPAAAIQYVFRPNPGCDLPALIELVKEAAVLWRKHGADVSLWPDFDSYNSHAHVRPRRMVLFRPGPKPVCI